ncbi:MAG: class I SAM-dependent methyltransferase [Chitinophagaceae bacterium]
MNKPVQSISDFDPHGRYTLEVIGAADKFNQWTYQTISPYLKGNVLEIGSGIGNISNYAIHAGHHITLSDFNPAYQRSLSNRFAGHANVESVISIDLQHPTFETTYQSLSKKFDSIFLLNVIEHLENDSIAVRNCRFLLKHNGHLIVLAPSYPFLFCELDRRLGHYRRYTTNTLARLFPENGLTVIHRQYFNFAGIGGWFLFGKLLGRASIGGEMKWYNRLVPLFRLLDKMVFHKAGLSSIVVAKLSE